MSLQLRSLRSTHIDCAIAGFPRGVTAVVGPNGAGKTSLGNAIAGLAPTQGSIAFEGAEWSHLAPHQRSVGLVPQGADLFPHLNVLNNVAFGPRSRGLATKLANAGARDWLELVGAAHLAERRIQGLSGGEAQRVALARALAIEPSVVLLDEPLAALDVSVAAQLRADLGTLLGDRVTLLITHDPVDIRLLAAHVVVVDEGAVIQQGSPDDIAAAPASSHAARLIGANVLTGVSVDTVVTETGGSRFFTSTPAAGPVVLTFAPTAVTLSLTEPHTSARNVWPARVHQVVASGAVTRVHLDTPAIWVDLTPSAAEQLQIGVGREVFASVKATEIQVLSAS